MVWEYCKGGCGRVIGYALDDVLSGNIPKIESGLMSMAVTDRDFHTCDYCKKERKR